MSGTNVALREENSELIPFDAVPDYLAEAQKKAADFGTDNFGKDDFATPRINLLQGLSPQITLFPDQARAGQFWHTGLNVNMGESFKFVRIQAKKKVILWRPRHDQGGGILALSNDAINWSVGGNSEFQVKLKNKKFPVTWRTRDNVPNSGLTNFGSSDPEDDRSGPAATVVYEYLVYVVGHPELSPAVFSTSMTSLKNAKSMNYTIGSMVKMGRPIHTIAMEAFVQTKTNDSGTWTMPNFRPAGFVNKATYDEIIELAERFKDYKVDYAEEQEDTEHKAPKYDTAY